MSALFGTRNSVREVEEGDKLQPKFDSTGLIPVITIDLKDNQVLMHGYMNKDAFEKSINSGYAHYWSRSRKSIWKKGETSGFFQKIQEIKIDDDQDSVIFFVELLGTKASCHVGYKSCFYRKLSEKNGQFTAKLIFTEKDKIFDPEIVYKNTQNPTKL
tara:strand:+ start:717 stop:1190 length:474 start_codon:yes stop_codon:yes gene_type:complete